MNFFRIFGAYVLSEKNKSEKNVFEVRKRKLATKILKKFTEVYFFTIIDRGFFQVFLSNRAMYRKYFLKILFFPVLFKWEKEVSHAVGKKNFSGGLMNISCILCSRMFPRIHIWAWTWKNKILGNKGRPNRYTTNVKSGGRMNYETHLKLVWQCIFGDILSCFMKNSTVKTMILYIFL